LILIFIPTFLLRFTKKMIISLLIINLAATQLISVLTDLVPKDTTPPHIYYWYICQLIGAAFMPYLCAAVLPYFVQSASGVPALKTKKL